MEVRHDGGKRSRIWKTFLGIRLGCAQTWRSIITTDRSIGSASSSQVRLEVGRPTLQLQARDVQVSNYVLCIVRYTYVCCITILLASARGRVFFFRRRNLRKTIYLRLTHNIDTLGLVSMLCSIVIPPSSSRPSQQQRTVACGRRGNLLAMSLPCCDVRARAISGIAAVSVQQNRTISDGILEYV